MGHCLEDWRREGKTEISPMWRLLELPTNGVCPAPSDKNVSGGRWRWCPQCGHELINKKCKLRCPRFHYFMNCPDFDFAG